MTRMVQKAGTWTFPEAPKHSTLDRIGILLLLILAVILFVAAAETYSDEEKVFCIILGVGAVATATFVVGIEIADQISWRSEHRSIYWYEKDGLWHADRQMPEKSTGWVFKFPITGESNRRQAWHGPEGWRVAEGEGVEKDGQPCLYFVSNSGDQVMNLRIAYVAMILKNFHRLPLDFIPINGGKQVLVRARVDQPRQHVFSDPTALLDFLNNLKGVPPIKELGEYQEREADRQAKLDRILDPDGQITDLLNVRQAGNWVISALRPILDYTRSYGRRGSPRAKPILYIEALVIDALDYKMIPNDPRRAELGLTPEAVTQARKFLEQQSLQSTTAQ